MSSRPQPNETLSDADRAIWAKFDAEVQKGLDSALAGDLMDADEFFDQLDAELVAMSKKAK